MIRRFHKYFGLICFLLTAGILLGALWPLNFFPKNKVEWLADRWGIRFAGRGIVYGSDALSMEKEDTHEDGGITIEIWLSSGVTPADYLARIVTLVDSAGKEFITLAQWSSHLYIVGGPITDPRLPDRSKVIVLGKTLSIGKTQLITLTSGSDGTVLYRDGKAEKLDPHLTLIDAGSQPAGRFILGDAPRGHGTWLGDIFGFALYRAQLEKEEVSRNYRNWVRGEMLKQSREEPPAALFLFDEGRGTLAKNRGAQKTHLIIPRTYRVFKKTVLEPPWKNFRLNLQNRDIHKNILGFIPLGFFLWAYLSVSSRLPWWKVVLYTIVLGAGLSLGIELLQVYLPSRNSQISDLICNTLGTGIGLVLSRLTVKKR